MEHMMSDSAWKYLRDWTKKFISEKYCPMHKDGTEHHLWFANCCTGSGKANLGFETVIQDIFFAESLNKESVHVMVAPTIMLSNQIVDEFKQYLASHYFYTLNLSVEFKCMNCESDDKVDVDHNVFNVGNKKHLVEVYCEPSFFGDESNPNKYAKVYNHFNNLVKNGWFCGAAVFDESQNYSNKWEVITGYRCESEEDITPTKDEDKIVSKMFSDVICMSGTPPVYQCWMSEDDRWSKKFVVSVNYALAIANGWIVSPDFYMVKVSDPENVLDPTIAVIEMEKAINKYQNKANAQTHLLVNCPTIDVAYDSARKYWKYIGCDESKATVIALHSDAMRLVNNKKEKHTSFINGKEVNSSVAKGIIKTIDKNYVGKTVVVFQVGMLSEGINVNSFDSVIITTHSDVKLIQQIGRSVRKFNGKNHTSVYAICSNEYDVANIADQLFKQGLNLEDVLRSIKLIDIPDSGFINKDPNAVAEYVQTSWTSYTPTEITKLIDLVHNNDHQGKINKAIKSLDPVIGSIYDLIKSYGGFGNIGSANGGSTNTGKKGKPGKKGAKGKKVVTKKSISPRSMIGDLKRMIKFRINNMRVWRDCIVNNTNKDEVVHYSIANLCATPMSNITKPNAKECEILRHLISVVYNQVKAVENENNK